MKLFYATDVHGSDRCFTKFVNAASFYGADAILLGGDLTGKAIVPLVRDNGVHRGVFLGEDVAAEGDALVELEKKIANAGYYSHRCDPDEEEALARGRRPRARPSSCASCASGSSAGSPSRRSAFDRRTIPCYMNAGNDDPAGIDAVLESSDWVQFLEGRVVDASPTAPRWRAAATRTGRPWNCPRDVEEDELGRRLEAAIVGRWTTRRRPSSTSTARRTTPASTPDRSWTRTSG